MKRWLGRVFENEPPVCCSCFASTPSKHLNTRYTSGEPQCINVLEAAWEGSPRGSGVHENRELATRRLAFEEAAA